MLNIGWHSNHPAGGTGYATQSDLITARLRKHGYTIDFSAFWGNQAGPERFEDMLVFGPSKEPYGNDRLAERAKARAWDIGVTLVDAWVMQPSVTSQFRWVPYFPVDCDPIPPMVAAALRTAYLPIAYSKFGQDRTQQAGIKAEYIPHCIDTQKFAPMDKIEARKQAGLPEGKMDYFIATIVAANKGNPSRKCFDQQIRAFAEFHKDKPNSILALHTDVWGGWQGENIARICELAGLTRDDVILPPPFEFQENMIDTAYMRRLYCSSDVVLNAVRGGGFELAIAEGMACGRPAIVTDCTAMPEIVDAGAGWKVKWAEKFFYQDSYQFIPDTKDITRALHEAYEARNDTALQEKARAGMVANYDADKVVNEMWVPLLQRIEGDIRGLDEKRKVRAAKRAAALLSVNQQPVTSTPKAIDITPEPVKVEATGD